MEDGTTQCVLQTFSNPSYRECIQVLEDVDEPEFYTMPNCELDPHLTSVINVLRATQHVQDFTVLTVDWREEEEVTTEKEEGKEQPPPESTPPLPGESAESLLQGSTVRLGVPLTSTFIRRSFYFSEYYMPPADSQTEGGGATTLLSESDREALQFLFPALHHHKLFCTVKEFAEHCKSNEHLFNCEEEPLFPLVLDVESAPPPEVPPITPAAPPVVLEQKESQVWFAALYAALLRHLVQYSRNALDVMGLSFFIAEGMAELLVRRKAGEEDPSVVEDGRSYVCWTLLSSVQSFVSSSLAACGWCTLDSSTTAAVALDCSAVLQRIVGLYNSARRLRQEPILSHQAFVEGICHCLASCIVREHRRQEKKERMKAIRAESTSYCVDCDPEQTEDVDHPRRKMETNFTENSSAESENILNLALLLLLKNTNPLEIHSATSS